MPVLCAPPTLSPSAEGTSVGGAQQSGTKEQHVCSAVVRTLVKTEPCSC